MSSPPYSSSSFEPTPPSSDTASASSSYILPTPTSSTTFTRPRTQSYNSATSDSIDSLPSESTTASDLESLTDSDYSDSDAEAEWQESIEQLELLLSMVLVPFLGKYLGRRCAYWSWTRFMEWKHPIIGIVGSGKDEFTGASGNVRAFAAL
ncbi:hypothetical protein BJY04DRAFT_193195 [Aspergillus karnatakaensis]|uniref:uncharacterized protein n=1 Tax=Aspergillus karnatakaensis TaxID=1810916 RepID=UPI003CCD53C3